MASCLSFRLAGTLAIGIAVLAPKAAASYVDPLSGREWRSPAEVLGFTWNAIAAVCSTDGVTPCDGNATADPSDDTFTGWIWSPHDQTFDLFRHVTGLDDELDDGFEIADGNFGAVTWGSIGVVLLGQTLQSTSSSFPDSYVYYATRGWSATSAVLDATTYGAIDEIAYCASSTGSSICVGNTNYVNNTSALRTEQSDPNTGAWLFRPAQVSEVPEPASLLLAGTSLAALALLRRRRSSR